MSTQSTACSGPCHHGNLLRIAFVRSTDQWKPRVVLMLPRRHRLLNQVEMYKTAASNQRFCVFVLVHHGTRSRHTQVSTVADFRNKLE